MARLRVGERAPEWVGTTTEGHTIGSATLRGQADRLALRLANHDEALNARLRPADTRASDVFEAVEQARVEAVGSKALAGVRANLNAALLTRLEKTGALRVNEAERVPVAEAVALLVRERLTGQRAPDGAGTLLDLVRIDLIRLDQREEQLARRAHDRLSGIAVDCCGPANPTTQEHCPLRPLPNRCRGFRSAPQPGDELLRG